MREKEFLSIIEKIIGSEYIGDDCAYLEDLGIVITHDSLIEDVHFKKEFITAYQLGYKSVMVNLSDVAASGAEPSYLTISLSLPNDIDKDFVENFYKGCQRACENKVKIVGGDITGADKIFISVCAIGKTKDRNISSRKNAQIGQKVVVSGVHGSSAAGLKLLLENKKFPQNLIKKHLEPCAQIDFGRTISTTVKGKYAMMDTSDGLMDALYAIASSSNVLLEIDFDKNPYDKDIEIFEDWKNLVLFGGEDYELVATVPKDLDFGYEIGVVKEIYKNDFNDNTTCGDKSCNNCCGIDLKIDGKVIHFSKEDIESKLFNHFSQ